jgi:hypothetical protein
MGWRELEREIHCYSSCLGGEGGRLSTVWGRLHRMMWQKPVYDQCVDRDRCLIASLDICWHRLCDYGLEYGLGTRERMPRTIHRLSTVKVASLSARGQHPGSSGLYLRITKTGPKNWIWRYSLHGRSRDTGLGSICAVSLARARRLAAECRRLLSEGHDPIRERVAERVRQRKAAACAHHDAWLQEHAEPDPTGPWHRSP